MHRSYLFFMFFLLSLSLSAQLFENFDDNDLSDWSGDIEDFIINGNSELQLMAPNEGISTIFTPVIFPDSLIWNIDVKLSFSPSTSNSLKLLLAIDTTDLSIANGYIIEIGETGSNDAANLIYLENGNAQLIATGIMGNVANNFNYRFSLTKDAIDNWSLVTTDIELNSKTQEFDLFFDDNRIGDLKYFGLQCQYTSTRTDLFSFDNIEISEIVPDTEGPQIITLNTVSANKLELVFDELVDMASAKNLINYQLSSNLMVQEIIFEDPASPRLCLVLSENLPSGQTVQLTVSNITDVKGNIMDPQNFELSLIETAQIGDLLINEILFDPYPQGDDFVEIINVSEKTLELKGLILRNADKNEDDAITRSIILKAGEIVAFTPDPDGLSNIYNPPSEALILSQAIPSFNNDEGNISLINPVDGAEVIVDAFDYTEDMHFDLLSDTEGVSLERISLISETNHPGNWFSSASSNNYATPGYENSARLSGQSITDDMIYLEHKVFSPNSDGDRDLLIINYNLDQPGYVANVRLFDEKGRFEKHLAQSELLGARGIISWDGILANGQLGPVGIYIIHVELFNVDGQVLTCKKVCVLAQQLN